MQNERTLNHQFRTLTIDAVEVIDRLHEQLLARVGHINEGVPLPESTADDEAADAAGGRGGIAEGVARGGRMGRALV